MKNLTLTLILSLLPLILFSQDIIVNITGDSIKAKVEQIETDNVKYRKASNQEGPLYTVSKKDIKEIIYSNGEKEIYNKNLKKSVFIVTNPESDVQPKDRTWKEEIEKCPKLLLTDIKEYSDLTFEFNIQWATGEARVSVIVYNTSDNKKLWESKRFRGKDFINSKTLASLNGIRRCIADGIIPEIEKGTF
jgi:hypothetical protein